jgi:hypothetical protein
MVKTIAIPLSARILLLISRQLDLDRSGTVCEPLPLMSGMYQLAAAAAGIGTAAWRRPL